jgi:predicted GH43/DUF377 family glycosyl hydrolase
VKIRRCDRNPIVRPGGFGWRRVATFNPGAILENGRFYLYERAAGSLRPFLTSIGLLASDDGVHYTHVCDRPVFTAAMAGYPQGSVQDARVVKIDGLYYLCYALQPYPMDCWPTGCGVPDYYTDNYPGWRERAWPMITQSGIAVSDDLMHFEHLCFVTPREIDDRDAVLFPEKIGGRFALLRRPVCNATGDGAERPSIRLSYSDDLRNWTPPQLLASPVHAWEGGKIGAAATPVRTERGWLLLYHGVDEHSVYRIGAMLLNLDDPGKVIARTKRFIMEPEEYYERVGLVIPNVLFPTGNVVRDGLLHIYYGCADTAIGLATARLDELVDHVLAEASE